ncbi:sciellin isoform 2-T4 [Pholidichthys leucotaenia]
MSSKRKTSRSDDFWIRRLNDEDTVDTSPTSYSKSYTTTKTTVTEEPMISTKTTKVTKDGTTTVTTTQSSGRTPTFTEKVLFSNKGSTYSSYTPKTRQTEQTVIDTKGAEDQLYDSLLPSGIRGDLSPTDSNTAVSQTETVIVRSSSDTKAEGNLYDTYTPQSIQDNESKSSTVYTTQTVTRKSTSDGDVFTTRTSSTAEDELYDRLLPSGIKSDQLSRSSSTKQETITVLSSRQTESTDIPSSTSRSYSYSSYTDDTLSPRTTSYSFTNNDYSSKTYSYSRPDSSYEYSSISSVSSPTVYKTYRSSSSDDVTDSSFSRSSRKSLSSERTLSEKDLCTMCHKPFTGEAKMILTDLKINCHAYCFKCGKCNITLDKMTAGDSLWVYRNVVHCEKCFDREKEKWRR